MTIKATHHSYPLWHPFTNMATFFHEGTVFVAGQGTRIVDEAGKTYINGLGSLLNAHCGLGRREIVKAVAEALEQLSFWSLARTTHPLAIELAHKLVDITPANLTRVFLTCTGSAAVEAAIKLVRHHHRLVGQPDKSHIVALDLSYHGVSFGAASASGIPEMHTPYEPMLPGFSHIAPPYCYRCAFGLTYPHCDLACAGALEQDVQRLGADRVGGFILEPVMGFGGGIVPPRGYFERVVEICRRYQLLLILDEVTTGFGRLGAMFAADHWRLQPDIMILSKGITSGYLPLGAMMCTDALYEPFTRPGPDGQVPVFEHGSTSDGHPACCAAALANVALIEREGLIENARRMGRLLLDGCQRLLEYPLVGDVRGLGLLVSIELVADQERRTPFPREQVFEYFLTRLFQQGLYLYAVSNCLMFFPPLTFSEDDVAASVQILEATLQKLSRMTAG